MQALTLIYYNTKRLSRYKALWAVLFALPIVAALLRSIFASSSFIQICSQACPFVCGILVIIILVMQHFIDSASGLSKGIRSAPVSDNVILVSRLLTGLLIIFIQMALFVSILALRF